VRKRPKMASWPPVGRAGGGCCSGGLCLHAASFDLVDRIRCRGRGVTVSRCCRRRITGHATHLAWSTLALKQMCLQASSTTPTSATSLRSLGIANHSNPPCMRAEMLTFACACRSLSRIKLRQARWSSWSTRKPLTFGVVALFAMSCTRTVKVVVCLYVSVVRLSP